MRGRRIVLSDAVGLGILAAAICFAFSWVPSVWYDEAATILASNRSWADLSRMLGTVDAVHGVYYGLMHVWFDLVGYTPLTLRLPLLVVAVGVLALVAVPSYVAQRLPQAKQADWEAVARQVRSVELGHPGDRAGIVWGGLARFPLATARVISYAYPEAFVGMTDLTLDETAASAGTLWETTRSLDPAELRELDAVWVIASDPSTDPSLAGIRRAGFAEDWQWRYLELEVYRFSRD